MRISIIGTGYVGLVTGVGFAYKGHDVVCVDVLEDKVKQINKGIPPIYEEGLEELLSEVVGKGKLKATTDTEKAVLDTQLTFICVGTPSREDGSIDTSGVEQAAKDIVPALKKKSGPHTICVKSTVVPGTTDSLVKPILEQSGKNVGDELFLGMNPEFLREGVALNDFLKPDRIVLGGWDKNTLDVLSEAYEKFDVPKLKTNIRTAEMIKYVSNALLATKISFANEISRICEKVGVDVYDVMDGTGLDHRLKRDFLNAGAGFGGSCFPKDVKALIDFAGKNDVDTRVLKSVLDVNEEQPVHIVERLKDEVGKLSSKKVAVLGLAFKGGTDDVRETRALPMVRELIKSGADVIGYDPKASDNFKELVPEGMNFAESLEEALRGVDICMIQNDWPQFKELKKEDFKLMKGRVIVDARRVLDPEEFNEEFTYIGVGI